MRNFIQKIRTYFFISVNIKYVNEFNMMVLWWTICFEEIVPELYVKIHLHIQRNDTFQDIYTAWYKFNLLLLYQWKCQILSVITAVFYHMDLQYVIGHYLLFFFFFYRFTKIAPDWVIQTFPFQFFFLFMLIQFNKFTPILI